MAKKGAESGVYRVTEIIGTSPTSWEDAARTAVETAAASLRDLRVAEVNKLDLKIEGGKVVAYRAKVSLSFKCEADHQRRSDKKKALERRFPRAFLMPPDCGGLCWTCRMVERRRIELPTFALRTRRSPS